MEPKIGSRDAFTVMGVAAQGDPSSMDYDKLWNQFMPYNEQVHEYSVEDAYYNVYFGTEKENVVEVIAGMSVADVEEVPEGLTVREVPAMNCAIFECKMKDIARTYEYIYDEWLPGSQYEHDAKPDFEHFPPDAESDDSPVKIYVAIK